MAAARKRKPRITAVLIERAIDLMWARCGPQDLPWSKPLLWKIFWLCLGVNYLGSTLVEPETTPAHFAFSFGSGLFLAWLLLLVTGKSVRFPQTLLALLVVDIVISLVFLPLALAAISAGMTDSEAAPNAQHAWIALLMLAVVLWKIGATANIWHHALEWPFVAGIVVALGLFTLELGLDRLLFPITAT